MRYLLIGGSAFVVEYALFLLLMRFLHGHYVLVAAQTLSFCGGLIVSFMGNRIFTFRHAAQDYRHSGQHQFVLYATLATANLIITNLFISILVDAVMITPPVAKLVIMAAVAGWNFIIFSKYIFKT
jgi:putative flippase GtrA